MIIAVDAMGGDHAPAEIVKGAARASKLHDVDIILVGREDAIRHCLPAEFARSGRIEIQNATEMIGMDEYAAAVRTKKDASVVVAACLAKEGKADAVVSVGNTAAAMAVATLGLGRIRGIDRPAIATLMPNKSGITVMLDAGAVVDCTPEILLQFGVMGSIYAQKALDIRNPRVGLLSIGEEKSKGNELTRATYDLLESSRLNFVGNVEGRDLFSGKADVIVADGFVGNVALKVAEGVVDLIKSTIKGTVSSDPLAWLGMALLAPGAMLMLPSLMRLKKSLDYREHGGAPLLGVDGVFVIGHGRSNAHAVTNAVRAAKEAVEGGVVSAIREAVVESPRIRAAAHE